MHQESEVGNQPQLPLYVEKIKDDYPTLLAETLTIREVVIETIKAKVSNIIIQSDCLIIIRTILGKIRALYNIFNIVADICILASIVRYLNCVL